MRKIALALAALLLPGLAAGQSPQFPQTLPANTVWGRLGIGTGPPQAIPFAQLTPNLTFLQAGLGAVSQNFQSKLRRNIEVADFGAICNGITDDTIAFQNAINQAQISGNAVRFSGSCIISSTLNITSNIDFGGSGLSAVLFSSNAAINIINITTASNIPVNLHDFSLNYTVTANVGTAAINVTGTASNENNGSKFERISTGSNANVGINFVKASRWSLANSSITAISTGIIVQNQNIVDSGDSWVTGVIFSIGSGGTGVVWNSSGGLRFEHNKINGTNLGFGFQFALASGANTANIFIIGNSIEGIAATGAAIGISRAGTTGGLGNIQIVGNELLGKFCVIAPTDATGAWLQNVAIVGNTCLLKNDPAAIAYSVDSTTAVNITGNSAQSFNAGSKLINVGSAVTRCGIGVNTGMGTFAASTFASGACDINLDGLKNGASGGVPYYSATGQLSSSAALAANAIVLGGGAGVAPSTTTAPAVTGLVGTSANSITSFEFLSGNAAAFTGITIGRTTQDGYYWVSGGANQFTSGTVAGDTGFAAIGSLYFVSNGSVPAMKFDLTGNATALQATASTSSATGALKSNGGIGAAGAIWAGTYLATTVTTVAGLPACGAGIKGARMFVSDNNTALAFAAVITSGGTIQTPVYCDGTVWRQG